MGQYYQIVNVDKRQRLHPHMWDNGMKLMEWSYSRNNIVLALMNLLAGEWQGDRVYVIGDYADVSDTKEVWASALYRLMLEFHTDDMYNTAYKFDCVVPEGWEDPRTYIEEDETIADLRGCAEDRGYRYIYNHQLRQYIDLRKCPIEWTWYDRETGEAFINKIAPLPLLLAMGNGRGGGDYISDYNGKLVGSWCNYVQGIEITKEPLEWTKEYDYTELKPDFTERRELLPWTEESRLIIETKEKERAIS